MRTSARPVRGPLPIQRISVAHLYSDTATVRTAPEASTSAFAGTLRLEMVPGLR